MADLTNDTVEPPIFWGGAATGSPGRITYGGAAGQTRLPKPCPHRDKRDEVRIWFTEIDLPGSWVGQLGTWREAAESIAARCANRRETPRQ